MQQSRQTKRLKFDAITTSAIQQPKSHINTISTPAWLQVNERLRQGPIFAILDFRHGRPPGSAYGLHVGLTHIPI